MPKVKKANRVLTVSDSSVPSYLQQGYDQINDKGKVVKRATGGRSVPISELNKALDEIERLKEELAETKKAKKKADK
ncbi:hypothetical protein [Salinithrix halophila]|uniref:Uncharacterized protein n=1 Tax=Salinithrix halophila TaxID=1485204 RepID=A0ABV8J8W2_9BACL